MQNNFLSNNASTRSNCMPLYDWMILFLTHNAFDLNNVLRHTYTITVPRSWLTAGTVQFSFIRKALVWQILFVYLQKVQIWTHQYLVSSSSLLNFNTSAVVSSLVFSIYLFLYRFLNWYAVQYLSWRLTDIEFWRVELKSAVTWWAAFLLILLTDTIKCLFSVIFYSGPRCSIFLSIFASVSAHHCSFIMHLIFYTCYFLAIWGPEYTSIVIISNWALFFNTDLFSAWNCKGLWKLISITH